MQLRLRIVLGHGEVYIKVLLTGWFVQDISPDCVGGMEGFLDRDY